MVDVVKVKLIHKQTFGGPRISVTGVNKAWATRAARWLADRSLASWYDPTDRSLNAFEFKHGFVWTDRVLREALEVTR